jgi:hypothetical protein
MAIDHHLFLKEFLSEILVFNFFFHCCIDYGNLFYFYSPLKQINSQLILHFLVAWQGLKWEQKFRRGATLGRILFLPSVKPGFPTTVRRSAPLVFTES